MPYTPPDGYTAAVTPAPILAARERAVALLTDRFADESLTEEEFEARLNWLSRADSVGLIEELAADLAVPRPRAAQLQPAYAAPAAEERLRAIMSTTVRKGQWLVPSWLHVRAIMSEVKLDLRYAVLPVVAQIDVSAVMANVRIIVPPELSVESSISAFMATVNNDADETSWAGHGAPRVLLTGAAFMAEVRVQVKNRRG